jgi:hypothetical protein
MFGSDGDKYQDGGESGRAGGKLVHSELLCLAQDVPEHLFILR